MGQYTIELNFGELEFYWDDITPYVTARVFGKNSLSSSVPLLSANWTLDQLSGRTSIPGGAFSSVYDIPLFDNNDETKRDQWKCVPYRGQSNPILVMICNILCAVAFFVLVLPMSSPLVMFIYVLRSCWNRLCRNYFWRKKKIEQCRSYYEFQRHFSICLLQLKSITKKSIQCIIELLLKYMYSVLSLLSFFITKYHTNESFIIELF